MKDDPNQEMIIITKQFCHSILPHDINNFAQFCLSNIACHHIYKKKDHESRKTSLQLIQQSLDWFSYFGYSCLFSYIGYLIVRSHPFKKRRNEERNLTHPYQRYRRLRGLALDLLQPSDFVHKNKHVRFLSINHTIILQLPCHKKLLANKQVKNK